MRTLCLLGLVCAATAAPLPAPPAAGLAIELTCSNPAPAHGTAPEFTAFLVNNGRKPATVVLPDDGSTCGWRSPVVRWAGDDTRGTRMRCGNINSLKPAGVVELAPGKRLKLEWVGSPSLDVGLNKVALTLEHVPGLKWRGLAHHDEATMKRVRELAAYKVTSNVVEVRVGK